MVRTNRAIHVASMMSEKMKEALKGPYLKAVSVGRIITESKINYAINNLMFNVHHHIIKSDRTPIIHSISTLQSSFTILLIMRL